MNRDRFERCELEFLRIIKVILSKRVEKKIDKKILSMRKTTKLLGRLIKDDKNFQNKLIWTPVEDDRMRN